MYKLILIYIELVLKGCDFFVLFFMYMINIVDFN